MGLSPGSPSYSLWVKNNTPGSVGQFSMVPESNRESQWMRRRRVARRLGLEMGP